MKQKVYHHIDDQSVSELFGGTEVVTATIDGQEEEVTIPFRPILRVLTAPGASYFRRIRGVWHALSESEGLTPVDEAFDAADEAKRLPK